MQAMYFMLHSHAVLLNLG